MTPLRMRVTVQQPCLAKYRISFFRNLAAIENIDLNIVYGEEQGIKNVQPEGFKGQFVPITHLPLLLVTLFGHAAQWRFASRKHSDVIVLAWNTRFITLLPSLIRARCQGVKTILWGHGVSKRESWLRSEIRCFVTHFADRVLFYDPHTMRETTNGRESLRRKSFFASNAIDESPVYESIANLKLNPSELDSFQRKWDLDPTKTILFVSRLLPENRLDMLVDAASKLSSTHPSLKLAIIGPGDEERAKLELSALRLGIADRLIFTGPIFEEIELSKWFLSARVFCYPENMGLSFYHALHYGLPVVSCDDKDKHGPEFRNFVNETTGLLYKTGSGKDLECILDRLLSDDQLANRLSQRCQKFARSHLMLSQMVSEFVACIESLNHE